MARLPFVQVDTDFITHGAAALAAVLGPEVAPAVAGWAVLQLRTWALSRASDEDSLGFIPGENAVRLVAAFAGWRGDPAVFLAALCDPAVRLAEVRPDGVQLLGLERDAAAVRKNRGDRERMSRRRSGDVSEGSSDVDGKTQTQTQTQTQKEETASQAAAVAAPPGGDLPDATEHAEEVPEGFTLTSPATGPKERALSRAEVLYRKFQELRLARCVEADVPAKDEEWAPARINKALGPFAKFAKGSKEANLFEDAVSHYLADDMPGTKDVPWGLGFFLASRATWEGRALKAGGGA